MKKTDCLLVLMTLMLSCREGVGVNFLKELKVTNSTLTEIDQDEETILSLEYSGSIATHCTVLNVVNASISSPCLCSAGACSVGITPTTDASFDFEVESKVLQKISNRSTITLETKPSKGGEWVRVPANAGGLGLPLFWVMKFETKAKADVGDIVDSDGQSVDMLTHSPFSTAENQPWRQINATDAALECESLGANYHLISNPEWIAIARNIEVQPSNWSGGSVGVGCLNRGNSGETTCGYNASSDPDSGTNRDVRAKHVLSNKQEIFDFAGNTLEWTDWDASTPSFQIAPTTCGGGIQDLPNVSCIDFADADYNSVNGSYIRADGVGVFVGGSGGAMLRGGGWFNGVGSGVYTVELGLTPSFTNNGVSFRCVKR